MQILWPLFWMFWILKRRELGLRQSAETKKLEEYYDKLKWYINKLGVYLTSVSKIPFEDLCQEGFLGIIRAKEKFDPKLASFYTYAQYWIKTYMYGLAFKHSNAVKIPEEYHFVYTKYLRLSAIPKYQKLKNKMRVLADKLGVTESRLKRIVNVMKGLKQSCPIDTLELTIESGDPDLCEYCSDRSDKNLKLLKQTVTPEEYFVLDHILGLEVPAPKTLNWIGNILGVTKERVRQIKNSGLAKFKEAYLDEYGGEPGEEEDE